MLGRRFLWTLLFIHVFASGQPGPTVDCVGCDQNQHWVVPESGVWSNPNQPGTQLVIEVQNGEIAGSYLGFDDLGAPVWSGFAGTLVDARPEAVATMTTARYRFDSGQAVVAGSVELTVLQRNHMLVAIDGAAPMFMVPEIFGESVTDYYPRWSDWPVPDGLHELWTWVISPPGGPDGEHTTTAVGRLYLFGTRVRNGVRTLNIGLVAGDVIYSGIECIQQRLDGAWSKPDCLLSHTIYPDPTDPFNSEEVQIRLTLANIGVGRVEGHSEAGYKFAAFRLGFN